MDYSDTTYHYNQVISANGEIKPLQGLEEKSFVYPWASPMVIEIKPLQGLEEKSFVYPWAAPMVIEIKPLQGLEENHFFMKEVQRTSISITSGATGGTLKHNQKSPGGVQFSDR
jgi:hypothetical protein